MSFGEGEGLKPAADGGGLHLCPRGKLEGGDVGADGGEGWGGLLDENGGVRATAESFERVGAGAGVKVEEAGAGEAGLEDVEEGLAEAVGGRPGGGAARGLEDAGAEVAGDDAHEISNGAAYTY